MTLEDVEDQVDDEDEADEDEPGEVTPAAGGDDETSLEEILAEKSKKRKETGDATEEDESVLSLEREDRVAGSLPGKVAPKQATEFVCRRCFLVKHQSQLANKKRGLCKDCA